MRIYGRENALFQTSSLDYFFFVLWKIKVSFQTSRWRLNYMSCHRGFYANLMDIIRYSALWLRHYIDAIRNMFYCYIYIRYEWKAWGFCIPINEIRHTLKLWLKRWPRWQKCHFSNNGTKREYFDEIGICRA